MDLESAAGDSVTKKTSGYGESAGTFLIDLASISIGSASSIGCELFPLLLELEPDCMSNKCQRVSTKLVGDAVCSSARSVESGAIVRGVGCQRGDGLKLLVAILSNCSRATTKSREAKESDREELPADFTASRCVFRRLGM
jgi:hypothetical protein